MITFCLRMSGFKLLKKINVIKILIFLNYGNEMLQAIIID